MIPKTLEEIYAAKEARRKELAALSINERVKIIEKLRDFGYMMRKARAEFERKNAEIQKASNGEPAKPDSTPQ
jgi:hypothetical protein